MTPPLNYYAAKRRLHINGYAGIARSLTSVMPQERLTLTEHRQSELVLTFTSECPYELGTNAAHGERGTAT